MRRIATVASFVIVVSASALARADDSPWGFGARVGGYGFREAAPEGGASWEDCRMGGMGLFAQRDLSTHLFLEAGVDQYSAEDPAAMDRVSTIGSIAGGLRMLPGRWISLHVEVGAGLELTRVAMLEHRQTDVLPMGFLGVGADVRLYEGLRLGANMRLNGMGHYEHDEAVPGADMAATPELASQGQVYLRYDL